MTIYLSMNSNKNLFRSIVIKSIFRKISYQNGVYIKEYNGSSWDSESLDPYSVIPLKHSGSIQMYLAKSTGPVYMGVEYGVFGKFRFMTQAAYDALSSYDEDTIYFVRSS